MMMAVLSALRRVPRQAPSTDTIGRRGAGYQAGEITGLASPMPGRLW
jgi:hypothetical protein